MKIIFEFTSPSLNVYLKWKSFKRRELKDRIWSRIHDVIWESGRKVFEERARVTYTRFSRGILDKDNLYASAKPFIDQVVKHGVLRDDSPDCIELICLQEKGKARTEILIEPFVSLEDEIGQNLI